MRSVPREESLLAGKITDAESPCHNQGSCWKQEKNQIAPFEIFLAMPFKEEGAELNGNDLGGNCIARRRDSRSPESLKKLLDKKFCFLGKL